MKPLNSRKITPPMGNCPECDADDYFLYEGVCMECLHKKLPWKQFQATMARYRQ